MKGENKMKNYDYIRSEVRSWVATAVLGDSDPVPMSVEDAAYNMKCYDQEGTEYPEGMTAELLSREWNRAIQQSTKQEQIAMYLRDNENVGANVIYINDAHDKGIKTDNPYVMPMNSLDDSDLCVLGKSVSPLEIMYIYGNSSNTFKLSDSWFTYDEGQKLLRSSNRPYHENMIDAMEIAEFCVKYDNDLNDDHIRSILDETEED